MKFLSEFFGFPQIQQILSLLKVFLSIVIPMHGGHTLSLNRTQGRPSSNMVALLNLIHLMHAIITLFH